MSSTSSTLAAGGPWRHQSTISPTSSGGPLDYQLNSLVGKVPHPSRHAELFCDAHRGLAKHHALDVTTHQQANSHESYRLLAHELTRTR